MHISFPKQVKNDYTVIITLVTNLYNLLYYHNCNYHVAMDANDISSDRLFSENIYSLHIRYIVVPAEPPVKYFYKQLNRPTPSPHTACVCPNPTSKI